MAEILLKDLTIGDNFFSPNLKKGKLNINLVPQQFGNLPPKDVIQTKLKVVMDNLGMNEDQRKGIMSLPEKSQWELVVSNSKVDSQAKKNQLNTPAPWIHRLKTDPNLKTLEELKVALQGWNIDSIKTFRDLKGFDIIFQILSDLEKRKNKNVDDINRIFEIIKCVKTMLNNKMGIDSVFAVSGSIKTLALCCDFAPDTTAKQRISIFQLLTVLCASRFDGHKLILESINNYKLQKREAKRFTTIIQQFEKNK